MATSNTKQRERKEDPTCTHYEITDLTEENAAL